MVLQISSGQGPVECEIAVGKLFESAARQTNSAWQEHNRLVRGNPVRVYEGISFKRRK